MVRAQIEAFEDCLERLQTGASLEQVLSVYPQWEKELRPLLESAVVARSLRSRDPISEKAMATSRRLFVERAVRRPGHRGIFYYRFSRTMMTAFSVVLVLAVATSLVSAKSIPGDVLYPVKLAGEQTRLLLTSNPASRLTLQEDFDQLRANEVHSVLQANRTIDVSFAGLLTRPTQGQWQVAGVSVTFPDSLDSQFDDLMGAYVEIEGLADGSGTVQVTQIAERELDLSGTVDSFNDDILVVDQIEVLVDQNTETIGSPAQGAYVSIKAYRLENNALKARQVLVINAGSQVVQSATPVGTETSVTLTQPAVSETPEAAVVPESTSTPAITQGSSESQQSSESSQNKPKEQTNENQASGTPTQVSTQESPSNSSSSETHLRESDSQPLSSSQTARSNDGSSSDH